MFHLYPWHFAWLATCCLLVCSIDAQIQAPCDAGYSGLDGGPCVEICAAGATTLVGTGTKNLARACGVSQTTACATGAKNGYGLSNINDNIIGALYHSSCRTKDWLRIDFGVARDIRQVKITYTDTRFLYRMPGAVVRVGNNNEFESNSVCATLVHALVNDHECVATGRYMFLLTGMTGGDACIVVQEIEAYGAAGAPSLVGTKNLARACGVSETTACATGAKNGYGLSNINDNIIGALFHSSCRTKDWLRIDFGVAQVIRRVEITYTNTRFLYRMPGAVVRVGNNNGFESNPVCATLVHASVNDHECVATGRYMFLVTGMTGGDACIVVQEIEAYGACTACPTGKSIRVG